MNIQEATASLIEYDYLIDKHVGDSVISHIVIAPSNGKQLDDILEALIYGYDYKPLLNMYNDFTLYFIYDLEANSEMGWLIHDCLEDLLPKLKG